MISLSIIIGAHFWKLYKKDLDTTIDDLFDWFCHNNLKDNPSKYHLFLLHFHLKYINI